MYFVGWASDIFLNTLLNNSPSTFIAKYGMHEIQPFGIAKDVDDAQYRISNNDVFSHNK